MEAAVWGVARWADTYLLSQEEDLSPAMAQSFGAAGNGPSVLAALVQLAGTLLNSPRQVCSRFSLFRRCNLCIS